MEDAPGGWTVWSAEESGRLVLVYRPDVFDGGAFPAPCVPTIYCTRGRPNRRPGPGRDDASDYFVTLTLEPEVVVTERRCDSREAAIGTVRDVAEAFDAGDVSFRDAYQVPRTGYLDRLDELTGRADG